MLEIFARLGAARFVSLSTAGKLATATQFVAPSAAQLAGAGVAEPETPATDWPVRTFAASPVVIAAA